jgi:hypothetical protein
MTNETKQTIVEWIEYQVKQQGITHYFSLREILEEAKEMEKEQKRKDFTDGYMHGSEPLNHDVIDKWYNKTYGGNK